MPEDILFYDSQENIQQCLSCKRLKCTNCLRKGGPGLSQVQDKIDPEKLIELWECGWNDAEIGEYFGVNRHNIGYYRKRIGLPSKQVTGRGKKNGRQRTTLPV